MDHLGHLWPDTVDMNDELGGAYLESGIENARQNNFGIVRDIELLVLCKRGHDVEIRHSGPYCDDDLSVWQGVRRQA
jgi:hypothetical protein